MAAARKPFLLRIPPALLEELRGWAEQEMRSLNGQIEFLLRQAVRRRKRGRSADSGRPDAPGADDPERVD